MTASAMSTPSRSTTTHCSSAASRRYTVSSASGEVACSWTWTIVHIPRRRRAMRTARRISCSAVARPDTATITSSGGAWTPPRSAPTRSATKRRPISRSAARLPGRKKLSSAVSTRSAAYTLPCFIRLRRASGVMSMNCTSSAASSTVSGTVSWMRTPVICSTRSLTDSRCWMFIVLITSMPASRSSSMSCQRLAWRSPGALVWASSSTARRAGRRAMHGVDVHVGQRRALVRDLDARHDLQRADRPRRCAAGRGSRRARPPRPRRPRDGRGPRGASRRSCPSPGVAPRYTLSRPRRTGRSVGRGRAPLRSVCSGGGTGIERHVEGEDGDVRRPEDAEGSGR